MYGYDTPDGYGDSFFIYNFNGEDVPLANGNSYTLVGVTVEDGMFVCRAWSGGALITNLTTGTIQMYDGVRCAWFQLPILQSIFPPSMAVLPEKVYRNNSALRFDATNVALNTNNNGTAQVYADQMAWYGVKRVLGGAHDPLRSTYKYYEKPFAYPIQVQLSNFGPSDGGGAPIPGLAVPTQYTQLISDFDFELRRISQSPGTGTPGSLLITAENSGAITVSGTPGASIGIFADNITIPNQPLTITVIGTQITIESATDGIGGLTSTATDVVNIINSTPAAAALMTAVLTLAGFAPINPSFFFIPGGGGGGGTAYASYFKMMLYDATWRQRMSVPILAELLCHNVSTAPPASTSPNNCWPSPPMMYPVNSVIRFDIYSLIPTGDPLPISINLLFEGVRRIAC